MSKAWYSYKKMFFEQVFQFKLSYGDKILLTTLLILVTLCGVSNGLGRDVGDYEKLQLVRLEAQQETIALKGQ